VGGDGGSLDEPYVLDASAVTSYRERGHCLVRGLLAADAVEPYRNEIERLVAEWARKVPALDERDTYHQAFLQVPNLWQRSAVVADFVLAPRFARVAAELMGVDGVRLYHDQALTKEPRGGFTPWHQDQRYWPLATRHTITMWMPLVDVPASVGTMSFASSSHARGELGPWVIGDDSEVGFDGIVRELGLPVETHGALRAGDATFHSGWTLHRAPPNGTDLLRSVMTVIYYADGTRVAAVGPTNAFDHQVWLDGIAEGELAAGPLNPLVWSGSDGSRYGHRS
jgi:ectoine hydroxylase-related dioxygenase (phytanoyl-CoA dioxygenase family)